LRILFIAGGSAPTVFALAPLATAARNSGHEVFMAATDDMMTTVAAAGLPPVSMTRRDIRFFIGFDRAGNSLEIPAEPVEQLLFTGRWFGRMAADSLPALHSLVAAWRPELVVGGTMSYAAPLIAHRLGVPYVRHLWDISDPGLMDRGADEELRPELEAAGLDRLPEPDLTVDICPPSIQRPDAPPAQLMRWAPANRQRQLEPWMYTPSERRRVCVTSGHRVARDQNFAFLRDLAATVTALDMEMFVAAPEDAAAELRAELPGVRADWMPLDVVIPQCDLLVSHAGGVTVMTAMSAGVPQLLLPSRDAKSIAPSRRMAEYGSAITLVGEEESPGAIDKACTELMTDPAYAARARDLAGEVAGLPKPHEVVTELERLV